MPFKGDSYEADGLFGLRMFPTPDGLGVIALGGRTYYDKQYYPEEYRDKSVAYEFVCPTLDQCRWDERTDLGTARSKFSGIPILKTLIPACNSTSEQ